MADVLIVEDEQAMRRLLSRWLAPAGYSLRETDSAPDALAMVGAGGIGVVLCDLALPGQHGMWLIDQLRTHHPSVAIVLATADASVPPRISLQAGVIGYLVKPFKQELVLGAVGEAMAWHRAAPKRAARPRPPGDNPIDTWLRGRAGRPDPKPEP